MRIKRFVVIIFFLLSFGSVSAQSVEETREYSGEQQGQIPDWFLDPHENEYVGVSFPFLESSDRMVFALTSALLSYEAQISRQSVMNRGVARSQDNKNYNDTQQGERKIDDTISFRIVRQFVNENGELFVALQIIPNSFESLQLTVAKSRSLQKNADILSSESVEILECSYQGRAYYFSREEKNKAVQGVIAMAYEDQSICRDLQNCPKIDYADSNLSTEELGWYYDCTESLHVAYMRALCTLILEGEVLKYPASLIDNRLIFYRHD